MCNSRHESTTKEGGHLLREGERGKNNKNSLWPGKRQEGISKGSVGFL